MRRHTLPPRHRSWWWTRGLSKTHRDSSVVCFIFWLTGCYFFVRVCAISRHCICSKLLFALQSRLRKEASSRKLRQRTLDWWLILLPSGEFIYIKYYEKATPSSRATRDLLVLEWEGSDSRTRCKLRINICISSECQLCNVNLRPDVGFSLFVGLIIIIIT